MFGSPLSETNEPLFFSILKEQIAKKRILDEMLEKYDDGHSDVFFCLAVNLLELDDLKEVMDNIDNLNGDNKLLKDELNSLASKSNIVLMLRK
ncbi:MAG: hypothetical protein IJ104_07670 [Methanobrevibacter sp.]|nr:hypothetical protein [Methanobrevibacter sp.]